MLRFPHAPIHGKDGHVTPLPVGPRQGPPRLSFQDTPLSFPSSFVPNFPSAPFLFHRRPPEMASFRQTARPLPPPLAEMASFRQTALPSPHPLGCRHPACDFYAFYVANESSSLASLAPRTAPMPPQVPPCPPPFPRRRVRFPKISHFAPYRLAPCPQMSNAGCSAAPGRPFPPEPPARRKRGTSGVEPRKVYPVSETGKKG